MTTFATFRSNVANKIGLDNTVSGDQGLIDSWINEGYVDRTLNAMEETLAALGNA